MPLRWMMSLAVSLCFSIVSIMAEDGCLHFVLPDICHLRELSGFLDDGQELGGGQLFFSIRVFHRASSGCNFHQQ